MKTRKKSLQESEAIYKAIIWFKTLTHFCEADKSRIRCERQSRQEEHGQDPKSPHFPVKIHRPSRHDSISHRDNLEEPLSLSQCVCVGVRSISSRRENSKRTQHVSTYIYIPRKGGRRG